MFGRQPRLPVDEQLGVVPLKGKPNYTEYVKGLKSRLDHAYKVASEHLKQAKLKQKAQYDVRNRGAVVQPGDNVLVKQVGLKGKNKLADKWEQDVYIVVSQPNVDILVYRVQNQSKKGCIRTLHRNMLLPIGTTNIAEPPENVSTEPDNPEDRLDEITQNEMEENDTPSEEVITIPKVTHINDSSEGPHDHNTLHDTDDGTNMEQLSQLETDPEKIPEQAELPVDNTTNVDPRTELKQIRPTNQDHAADPEHHPGTGNMTNNEPEPNPMLRCSDRVRNVPKWMRTGEYIVHSAQTVRPDWVTKAQMAIQLLRYCQEPNERTLVFEFLKS
jgi:hypothetical protein